MNRHARYPDQQEILLVACRLQDIETLTSTMQRWAGGGGRGLEGFALERSARPAGVEEEDDSTRWSTSRQSLRLPLLKGGRSSTAGQSLRRRQLTDAISKRYGMSSTKPPAKKRRVARRLSTAGAVAVIDTLIQHVGRSLQLYYTAGSSSSTSRPRRGRARYRGSPSGCVPRAASRRRSPIPFTRCGSIRAGGVPWRGCAGDAHRVRSRHAALS
nr:hypothetical protein [Salinicola acroporae]